METGATETLVHEPLEAARDELVRGLGGLLDQRRAGDRVGGSPTARSSSARAASSPIVRAAIGAADLAAVGDEGYVIRSRRAGGRYTVIAGNTEVGAPSTGRSPSCGGCRRSSPSPACRSPQSPRVKHRHLNYWDTERLYAGNNAAGTGGLNGENGAVFNFAATGASAARNLPVILDRYIVVARALASVGINGITINNVNANNAYLTPRLHRAGGGAGRRAAPVRHPARGVDQLHRADRQPVRAGHADQPAARPRGRGVPRLVDAQGAADPDRDPGLPRLHRQGQLRGPAGPAGLRRRPRRRRQRRSPRRSRRSA